MENALIPLLTAEAETAPMCNARDLHAALQVDTRFNDWIARRIEDYGFVDGFDFRTIDYSNLSNQKKGRGGARRSIDYHLTLDMAKELAMLESNEIGRQVRRYFIRAETELRERVMVELRDKARHVLPVRGVKLMRDGLSMKDTFRLQDQSQKVMRMIMAAETKAERQNLHLHFHQINLTLGVPTIEFEQIEAEIEQRRKVV